MLICISILSLLFLSAVVSQEQATHQLPSGLIFTSPHVMYGERGLYYVDPDTLEMETLLEGDFERAFWSPDGTHIAVVETAQRICIYQFSEQDLQCVDMELPLWEEGDMRYFPIVWHADGEHILSIVESRHRTPQLGSLNISDNDVTFSSLLPIDNGESLRGIYWSPSGRYLAYQTFPGEQTPDKYLDPASLHLMDVQTGETRIITNQSQTGCIAWSANSDRIGVVSERWYHSEQQLTQLFGGITVYDVEGNILDEIQPQYEGQDISGCFFAWSNDGTRLAFLGRAELPYGGIDYGLFVTELNSDETFKVLSPYYYSEFFRWSPDDTHIVTEALSSYFSDIRVISLDGWERGYSISNALGGGLALPDWRPSGN